LQGLLIATVVLALIGWPWPMSLTIFRCLSILRTLRDPVSGVVLQFKKVVLGAVGGGFANLVLGTVGSPALVFFVRIFN